MAEPTPSQGNMVIDILNAAQVAFVNDILARNDSTDSVQVAIPDNYQVIDTERYEKTPNHFRGFFKTNYLKDYLAYMANNPAASAATFVSLQGAVLSARSIIDMGEHAMPEWGKHRAELNLKMNPEYETVLLNHEKKHSQRYFIEFAEDWIEHIVFLDAENKPIERNKALTALRKLTVATLSELHSDIGDTKFSASAFESIEMKSKTECLPVKFTFTCAPYPELASCELLCKLRPVLDGNEKTLVLKYRIANLNAVQQACADEFKAALVEGLPDGARIYTGEMTYQV